jgi:cyclic-di-GMP phosphodiesterase TipF (flagellum assembly factor)
MSLILHIEIIASYFVLVTAVALLAPALVSSLTADLTPKLYFEFGQSDIETAPPATIGNLGRLADLGFRVSLDQVTYLYLDIQGLSAKNFWFVKLDASFLLDRDRDLVGDIAREDIKKMLDRDGLDLIVEKIEDEAQLVELLDFEIDFGQGYLFCEPRLSRTDSRALSSRPWTWHTPVP